MKKELLISYEEDASKIALIEDGRLFELHEIEQKTDFVVGDIFVGKIKKLAPNLNAAFVNIGYEKDAFLHYQDLGPQYLTYKKFLYDTTSKKQQTSSLKNFQIQPEIDKNGTVDKVMAAGDEVLLQITKEPISTKGPEFLPRFLLLVDFWYSFLLIIRFLFLKKLKAPKKKPD
jgi:ribonuclease G